MIMPFKIIKLTLTVHLPSQRSYTSCQRFQVHKICSFCCGNITYRSTSCTNFLRRFTNPKIIINTMRFIQFERKESGNSGLGVLSGDATKFVDLSAVYGTNNMIEFIKANIPITDIEKQIESLEWEEIGGVKLLAPITNPEKIVCIGFNYLGHCLEHNKEPPSEPIFFSKFANSITGPTGDVVHHGITTKLDWEVELAVVIGTEARHVSVSSALDHIFGYTVAQDISARDWQLSRNGGQFLMGKTMDTFCPLGPAIVHRSLVSDPHNLRLTCNVNGVPKQVGNTSELIFRIDDIIHRLSQSITLKPGDVILTGTPSGVGMHRSPPEFLTPGDVIESEIENIGKIVNKVVSDSA